MILNLKNFSFAYLLLLCGLLGAVQFEHRTLILTCVKGAEIITINDHGSLETDWKNERKVQSDNVYTHSDGSATL